MPKRTMRVYPTAFSWFSDIRAAQDYGRLAAEAFARAARADAKKIKLEAGAAEAGKRATVVAADAQFNDWILEVDLESVINDYLRSCIEYEEAGCLDAAAAMLERAARKARKLRTTLPEPPTSGV